MLPRIGWRFFQQRIRDEQADHRRRRRHQRNPAPAQTRSRETNTGRRAGLHYFSRGSGLTVSGCVKLWPFDGQLHGEGARRRPAAGRRVRRHHRHHHRVRRGRARLPAASGRRSHTNRCMPAAADGGSCARCQIAFTASVFGSTAGAGSALEKRRIVAPRGVQDLDRHRPRRRGLQVVVDDRAVRRILRFRLVLLRRRPVIRARRQDDRVGRLEEMRVRRRRRPAASAAAR